MQIHIAAICPVPANAPVIYHLADGVDRFTARADALCWADLPADEGRVIEFAPLVPGPWRLHHTAALMLRDETPVEVEFSDGSRYTDTAGNLAWALDLECGRIERYRVLAPRSATTPSASGAGRGRTLAQRARPRRVAARVIARWLVRSPMHQSSERCH